MIEDSFPKKKKFHYFAFIDLDGTLLTNDFKITQRTRSTIHDTEKKANVIIASGRPAQSCLDISKDILNNPSLMIASNGGVLINGKGKILYSTCFKKKISKKILDFSENNKLALCVYHPLIWYTKTNDYGIIKIEEERSNTKSRHVKDLTPLLSSAIKFLIIAKPDVIKKVYPQIKSIPDINTFISYPEYIEVMPKTSNKGKAAKIALSYFQEKNIITNSLSIGDGIGDISLFLNTDISVAVSNAAPEVLSSAQHIAPSNEEDGVALALEAFILKYPPALKSIMINKN